MPRISRKFGKSINAGKNQRLRGITENMREQIGCLG